MGIRNAKEERASYAQGYEQDAASWRRRIEELEALGLGKGDPAWEEAQEAVKNALRGLAQYGGRAGAEKRPSARAKDKRA